MFVVIDEGVVGVGREGGFVGVGEIEEEGDVVVFVFVG